jgi:hypothetical protein
MVVHYVYRVISPDNQWTKFYYQRSYFVPLLPAIVEGRFVFQDNSPLQSRGGKHNLY